MNTSKILKIIAIAGITISAACALIKNIKSNKKKKNKNDMLLIARQINNDIKNTERKISRKYHKKNQEKYDNLWGNDSICKF